MSDGATPLPALDGDTSCAQRTSWTVSKNPSKLGFLISTRCETSQAPSHLTGSSYSQNRYYYYTPGAGGFTRAAGGQGLQGPGAPVPGLWARTSSEKGSRQKQCTLHWLGGYRQSCPSMYERRSEGLCTSLLLFYPVRM